MSSNEEASKGGGLREPRVVWIVLLAAAAAGLPAGAVIAARCLQDDARRTPAVAAGDEDSLGLDDARWAPVMRGDASGRQCSALSGPASGALEMGTTAGGNAWLGSSGTVLEVQEFTDLRCPDCRKADMKVRRLLAAYPGRVRVVNRHFPMDAACNPQAKGPFHDRACELARIAVCAGRQGRFWETYEFLLQNADAMCAEHKCALAVARRLDLDEDAFQCCMSDPAVKDLIARDVAEGARLGVHATPTFVIDGHLYEKAIPEAALARLHGEAP